MNMYLTVRIVTDIQLLESTDLIPLDFCLRVWMKNEVYKINVDTRYELLARILDVANRMKKRQD